MRTDNANEVAGCRQKNNSESWPDESCCIMAG